ncbi:dihydrodipicolinate synthase family protein (plasmid) [Halorarum halophilum]|uniref:Dihydrodipicolinate synthase family protein n=1 Tax=Halorarum halophilum TaxID=2743090 RepID=A0A7D5KYI0_9EURY|nr:dihydrodipicolinate synthase family protein [Halobaculum halophilum]QLG29938.1 dihydrodipicolinate synthase family protein [Halobaculum halophilum]
MSYNSLKRQLQGVAFTTATPFTEDGTEVNHDALTENLQTIESAGGNIFIPCGNTGEYYSLSNSERVEVAATHFEATSDDATIVAGAGGSTKTAKSLISQYEKLGVDAVLIMYPRHTYIHERGLIEYFQELADSTDLGLVIYKRGETISRQVITKLSTIENVVGVKYAVNDINDFSQTVSDTPGDLVWLNGIAERYAPSFALEGAEGNTTGIGNFVPEAILSLQQAVEDEDWERTQQIRDLLRPFEDLREETGRDNSLSNANNVPAVKYGLELAGLYGGPVRKPLVELCEKDKQRIEEYYQQVQDAAL